jgi:hypothetical protein
MHRNLYILIGLLFVFRTVYGLFAEFWFEDELQIYLIGLKWFTTETWPYYGPDLVYTNTQIPGALQGLMVGAPLFVVKQPEAPAVFLNILSFTSLAFLATYICWRFPTIPRWFVWVVVMTTPWAMYYSTRVVNPSYALVFSVPFFVVLLDRVVYPDPRIKRGLAWFIMGLCTTAIMQLHMSWVLLLPLAGLAFLYDFKTMRWQSITGAGWYVVGGLIGGATVIPTYLLPESGQPDASSNIVFNPDNWTNLPVIIARFFSFAANEIPYVLGGNTEKRMDVVTDQLWMSPVVAFLYLVGFVQTGFFVVFLFFRNHSAPFKRMRLLTLVTFGLLYISFFFSIKGPASHTFYMLFPMAMFYAFFTYNWLMDKPGWIKRVLYTMAISGIVFHVGLGLYNLENKSLYKNRGRAVRAIQEKDYTLLGARRADNWGYGY